MSKVCDDKKIMELVKFRTSCIIKEKKLKDCEISVNVNLLLDAIVVNLKKTILGEIQHKEWLVDYVPETWKDSFKLKHENKWWMKRWLKKYPVKYRYIYVDVDKVHIFPFYEIPKELRNDKYITLTYVRKKIPKCGECFKDENK